MLHVTNGTSVSLGDSGIAGEVLVWSDVLHEGPVPAGLDANELRRVRALFLDNAWPSEYPFLDELSRRDALMAEHDELALWFEHDLFDQLQLIQILDRLRERDARLSLICIDRYLGRLTGAELAELWPARHDVTAGEFDLAAAAWRAFRSPDPMEIARVLESDTSVLPFLAGALRRHLQQFPSVENGLSRTERQILEAVAAGAETFPAIFVADQQREERIFMGDSSLKRYLQGLVECRHALLRDDPYALTQMGRDVMEGRADNVRLNGIDRWLGGVHLRGNEALWRWDERAGRLRAV
ncbi:MAG TPA: hypothetical protein VGF59_05155 [Bryobacteraceae bacterium]